MINMFIIILFTSITAATQKSNTKSIICFIVLSNSSIWE
jgi:hypothetical protein